MEGLNRDKQRELAMRICFSVINAANKGTLASATQERGMDISKQGDAEYNGTETISIKIGNANGAVNRDYREHEYTQITFNFEEGNVHGI